MDFIDYYKVLGIKKESTQDQIRAAYRKLARKHHPDLNPDDKEANKKFQQINEANEVLSDPEKRKKYDQYGKDWQHAEAFEKAKQEGGRQGAGRGAGNPFDGGSNPFGGSGGFNTEDFENSGEFSDFFESLFGGGRRSAGGNGPNGNARQNRDARYRGQDYQAQLSLTLTDAATTHQQVLTVNEKNIRITIPAGVANGQTIKLKGHGAPGANGGPDGDLYITFSIAEDPRWTREGDDLHMKAPLDLYTAILGGEITVETLTGKVKLKVKPETANETVMRLKGKGFPVYKKEGQHGDLYVSLDIKIPANLTEKEKDLFRQLRDLQNK